MTLTRKLTAIIMSALTAVCLMMPQAADAARRVPPVRGGQANSTVAAAPDFAMPRQVEKNALKALDIALREGRDPQAVRALADWALAQAAVSADSATVVIDRLHSVCGQVESPVAKAMILALEARVYTNLFRADQWTYTERPTVEGVGEDFTRWSVGQFAQRVDSLVMQSLRAADELMQTPISAYDKVIDIDRAGQVFYPTLYDFVAYQGIECLNAFDRDGRILNERLVDDPGNASLYPAAKPLMRHILEIYSSLADFHRDRAAALVAVNLARYNYIGDHVYDTDDSVGEALDRRYLALYHGQVGTTPQAVRYLLAADDVDDTTMYGLLTEFEKSHPDYDDINAVKNRLATLSAKSVSASYRQAVAPGVPFPVVVRAGNVAHATVSLYDITSMKFAGNDPTQVKYANVKALLKSPVATRRFDYAGKAVPFAAVDTIEFTCAGPGRFIIVAEGDGCSLNGDYLPVIASSALTLASAGDDSNRLGVVVDPVSGAPQAGVSVLFRPWSRRGGETTMPGQTDSKGELKLTTTEGGSFQPRRGDDIYARWAGASSWYDYSEKNTIYSAELQTSLGLYHPGDTVAYAVVVTRHTPRGRSLAADETVKVMLRDANYQEVATQTLTTDSWGRQQGTVALPATGLQGRFVLEVYAGDKPDNAIGSTRFMVSDYRLPTFQVSDLKVLPPATPADSAVVSGKALTYAGFPVADAKVAVSLAVRGNLWRWSPSTPVYATVNGVTDAQGNISVVIPADVISSAPVTGGYFTASVAVTSADGETRQGQTGFNLGQPMTIDYDIPQIIDVDKPVKAEINAYDWQGNKTPLALEYKIKGKNAAGPLPEVTGSFSGGSFADVIKSLPTGRYSLDVAAADSTQAAPVSGVVFTVYSQASGVSPTDAVVWLPQSTVIADADGHAQISFASAVAGASVWMLVSTKDNPISQTRWIETVEGMQTVDVLLDGDSEALVQLCAVRDFTRETARVSVLPASSRKSLDLKIETFRDKVTPGDTETLTLKVSGREGASASSAVMASMTNAALGQLAFSGLAPMHFPEFTRVSDPWLSGWSFMSGSTSASLRAKWLKTLAYDQPAWQLYGRSLFGPMMRVRGSRMLYGAAAMGTDDLNVVREHKMAAMVTEAADGAMAESASADTGGSLDEVVTVGNGAASREQGADGADGNAQYRPSEIPLAFFEPMLATGPDGSLTLRYTVPQANTTWLLSAVAYNAELLLAAVSENIVASKSLMVNLNTPSFLRGGDKVTVRASVMNNTDSVCSARGTVEVLDQADGRLIASKPFSLDSLAAKGTAIVAIDYQADPMTAAVLFRVKASDGRFTDGEQVVTRIIPSDQDVMRSTMFFIPSDSTSYSVSLEPVAPGGRALLQYTENPAWEVVTALPGLREKSIGSSVEAAHALFSARVADGLTRQFPEITHAIRRWAETPGDSALVSQLMKNSEMRQVVLSATPWVSAALDDTQRLQRLALLLDPRESARVVAAALETLSKTAVSGGGWCWTPAYPHVSQWATEEVLVTLGLLAQMDLLPDNSRLERQLSAAWDYIDRETVKEFARNQKADFTSYVYTRGLYRNMKRSTAVARVVNATVQNALASWRKATIGAKAVYASMLKANGYAATARQIVESLRQHATVTPEKGMWWQQLDREAMWRYGRIGTTALVLRAFHETDPKSADIDRIRQWLVLQKQNTDWGSSAVTSLVVATILRTGADWVVAPRHTAIHIGTDLVEAQQTESYTGRETVDITPMLDRPQTMTIDRRGGYPSCGAVVTMERLPMSAVGQTACQEASVAKSVTVSRNGGVWMPADTVAVGDRVLVAITIKADDDLDYVVITDPRPAGCDLVSQMPAPVFSEGLCFYRENGADNTNIYIDHLPRGVYVITYELFASRGGCFSVGASQLQSQYNPLVTAHSAGSILKIND